MSPDQLYCVRKGSFSNRYDETNLILGRGWRQTRAYSPPPPPPLLYLLNWVRLFVSLQIWAWFCMMQLMLWVLFLHVYLRLILSRATHLEAWSEAGFLNYLNNWFPVFFWKMTFRFLGVLRNDVTWVLVSFSGRFWLRKRFRKRTSSRLPVNWLVHTLL